MKFSNINGRFTDVMKFKSIIVTVTITMNQINF